MSEESWRETTLGEVVTLQRGFDITKKDQCDGPYPVISSSGPGSRHNEFKVQGPGVVIGRKGSLGGVYYSQGPFWPHDTTLWVKDFKGSDPRFVYYWFQTLGLEYFDVGASNPTLNRNHLHLLPVRAPELSTQQRIASVLTAYDELIENNTRRVQILEEMAQAIYREWFVEFRYPGHEDVLLVDSNLGPIPEGWEVHRLADLVTTQYGYTESTSEEPVGPKFLRGMDMNKTSFIDWDLVPYCPIDADDVEKYRLAVGDVLIIRMADPGKIGIVEQDVEAVFASYLVRIRPLIGAPLRPYFLFYFLNSNAYQGYVTGASTGTTRKSVSAKVMTGTDLVVPAIMFQDTFEERVGELRGLIGVLLRANAKLRATRDLLLPRLISGEIDVSDLEIDVGDAAA